MGNIILMLTSINAMVLNLLLFCMMTHAFKQDETGCQFPEKWQGSWFQSGVVPLITIQGSYLSSKGRCLASEGDKFLLLGDKGCYRCVVIHEKHPNVLQYKETYCHQRDTIQHLSQLITGDALLYSMFREDPTPVACPLRGPFTFTYNRGHGECRSPVSNIDSCTEDSRLLLSYQACPDVYGTESTVEELQCLATWKEGNARYLVGKVSHRHATSNEDRYRCFVYEKTTAIGGSESAIGDIEYYVAQSGDATCNGLFSATEGSRTMALRKASTPARCRFPGWLAGALHWHSVDQSISYSFHHRNASLRVLRPAQGAPETRAHCSQINRQTSNDVMIVVQYTEGCQSGFMCMHFYRRDTHLAEIQTGTPAFRLEDACAPKHFDPTTLPYITILPSAPEPQSCPMSGRYITLGQVTPTRVVRKARGMTHDSNKLFKFNTKHNKSHRSRRDVQGCSKEYHELYIGCGVNSVMEFKSECPSEGNSLYACHGSWLENGTTYLVASLNHRGLSQHRVCFSYRESGETHSLIFGETCDRNPEIARLVTVNITSLGQCSETNSAVLRRWDFVLLLGKILSLFIPR